MFKHEPSPSCRAGRLGSFRPVEYRVLGIGRAVVRCAAQEVVEGGVWLCSLQEHVGQLLTAARTHLARRLTLTVSRHHVEPTTPSWRRLLTSRRLLPPVRRQSSLPASTAAALNRTTPPHVCRRAPQADSHDIVTTSSSRQRRHGAGCLRAADGEEEPHAGEDIWQRWSDDEQELEHSDFSVLEPDGDGVSSYDQDS